MTLTNSDFFRFARPRSQVFEVDWAEGENWLLPKSCPFAIEHNVGGPRNTVLSIVLQNAPVPDIIWAFECIIQDRVLRMFQSEGFSGFDVAPVKARFLTDDERQPPILWELIANGWGGMASPHSGIRRLSYCPGCGHQEYGGPIDMGRFVDVGQWDGSDFFIVWPLPRYILVTNRVADFVQRYKLAGVRVISLAKIGHINGAMPYGLRYVFDDARARKLGEPLGIY